MLQALRFLINFLTLTPAGEYRHRQTDTCPDAHIHTCTHRYKHTETNTHTQRGRESESQRRFQQSSLLPRKMQPGGDPDIQPPTMLTNLVTSCRPRLGRQGAAGAIRNRPLLTALQVIADCLMAAGHPHLGGQTAGLPLRATPLRPNQRTGEFARRDGCHLTGWRIICCCCCWRPRSNSRMSLRQLSFRHMPRRGLYLLLLDDCDMFRERALFQLS
jgi:hypothetical protein